MKSLMPLMRCLLSELGRRCGISTTRDEETVTSRVEHEGISFLTISLPTYGKDLEEALDIGRILPTHFRGFSRSAGIPKFLGGFLKVVFDAHSGVLLEDPDLTAIHALRQVTLMWAKMKLECSDERTNAAFETFVSTERHLRSSDRDRSPSFIMDYRDMATRLWGNLLAKVDLAVYNQEILPKHGPGSTANRVNGNAKFGVMEWTDRLEAEFPWLLFAAASWRQFDQAHCDVLYRAENSEIPVRVIAVPKTLKTPRIIAIEPSYMQYMQQGILEAMVGEIKDDRNGSSFIDFVDTQPVNQKLARKGSIDGSLATLDLSEASDRVSNQLVRNLLLRHPHLFRAVDACRSRSADVPNHGVMRLAKFASMGSALTFPMEAMVFCTLIFMAIERDVGHKMSAREISSYAGKVRVYGDDIIIPVENVPSVIGILEDQGLKVNRRKSFWTGRFRESCGKEYYAGTDVSIVRFRAVFPRSQTDVTELVSAVSFRNLLWENGYNETVEFLDRKIKALIPFPSVQRTSPALGKWHHSKFDIGRFHPTLQRAEVRALSVVAKSPSNSIDGYGALLKMYLKRSQTPYEDPLHLVRSGRPHAVSIKRGWVPVA